MQRYDIEPDYMGGRMIKANDGDYLDYHETIRELATVIEPVVNWYDSEGEGKAMSLPEIVADIAKSLKEDRERVLALVKALRDIVKHQEAIGGGLSQLSATKAIAERAIAEATA